MSNITVLVAGTPNRFNINVINKMASLSFETNRKIKQPYHRAVITNT